MVKTFLSPDHTGDWLLVEFDEHTLLFPISSSALLLLPCSGCPGLHLLFLMHVYIIHCPRRPKQLLYIINVYLFIFPTCSFTKRPRSNYTGAMLFNLNLPPSSSSTKKRSTPIVFDSLLCFWLHLYCSLDRSAFYLFYFILVFLDKVVSISLFNFLCHSTTPSCSSKSASL